MTPSAQRAKDVFLDAIALDEPERRAAFLDEACAGDPELRRRVEALLAAHDRPESLLDRAAFELGPAVPYAADDPSRPAEGPGTVIGPYTLHERLGEGGMGAVYRAEQSAPVRRTVALKVIKPGMDSAQVVARFDAERQALALMDHPNIATVLDAGTTPAGRPYFVMELVRGAPITRYCDDYRLTLRQRLELFLPVCQAVQHAHQKGVIHRDLKPSNVLVAQVDGKPVPKVIDFGVAKAIDRRLTERTLLTRFGAIIGTPEYMSPEQAGASPDVDTRTDVYALGVLLYELLTGTTPLDPETLRRAALDEVLRRVREEEPPRPSTRLSATNDRLPSVAAQRDTEPARLSRLVRGDLDWVVMKALEKDRARRYETAAAFARDVQRFLDGDPVEAGPPSRSYRVRKFARKHRAGLATAGAFALLLIAAAAVSTSLAVKATRAERAAQQRLGEVRRANAAVTAALTGARKAEQAAQGALKQSEEARRQAEAVSEFLVEAFRSPDPRHGVREVKVADLLDRAEQRLGQGFTGSEATRGTLLNTLGETYLGLGWYDKAASVLQRARAVREATLGPDHPEVLSSRNNLAAANLAAGRIAEAIALHEATLKLLESKLGPDHPETLTSRNNLAAAYYYAGRITEAIALFEAALKIQESKLGPDHPETLGSRNNLAAAYLEAGRTAEAIGLFKETLRRQESKLGPDHPDALTSRNNLAQAYVVAGRTAEAVALHEGTLRLRESRLGPDHPNTLASRVRLAEGYLALGRWTQAEPLLRECLRVREAKQPDHWLRFYTLSLLGRALLGLKRYADAEPLIVQGYEGLMARAANIPQQEKARLPEAARRVVRLYEAWGRPEQAAAWKAKLGLVDLPADVFGRP